MKSNKTDPNFDYLRGLVNDQMDQLRRFGPIVFEIFETLETSGTQMELDPLIERVLSQHKTVVRVDTDMINLRAGPSLQAAVIKMLERGAQLLLTHPEDFANIGASGAWLHVLDLDGDQGYVVGQYVLLDREYGDPQVKVEVLMHTLDSFNRMELVNIDPNYGLVHLTTKGENIARMLRHTP